jgi:hypothetical protein
MRRWSAVTVRPRSPDRLDYFADEEREYRATRDCFRAHESAVFHRVALRAAGIDLQADKELAEASRLPKTNRADLLHARHKPHDAAFASPGNSIREEATFDDVRPGEQGTYAKTWEQVKWDWAGWFEESERSAPILENVTEGERFPVDAPNSYSPEYQTRRYAKLKDLERGIQEGYGDLLHTAMLTFTASNTDEQERYICPADHLDGLTESWDSVRRSLSRELEDKRGLEFERLAILEPHASGYTHIHLAVFVKGPVREAAFEPVIDAHVRNSSIAERDAHEYDEVIAVKSVAPERRSPGDESPLEQLATETEVVPDGGTEDGEIQNLGAYLSAYIGGYDESPLEADEHVKRFYSLMWATGTQRWRPSNGAQEYMKHEPPESDPADEIVFVGVSPTGEPEDVIESEAGARSSPYTTVTKPPPGSK